MESSTPNRLAVAGISCIRPVAPTPLTASDLPADSIPITARTKAGDTSVPMVAIRISVPCALAIFCNCCKRGFGTALPSGAFSKYKTALRKRPGPESVSFGETPTQYHSNPVRTGALSGVVGSSASGAALTGANWSDGSTCTLMRLVDPLLGTPTRLKVKLG